MKALEVDWLLQQNGPRPLSWSLRRQNFNPTCLHPPSANWQTCSQRKSNQVLVGWRLPTSSCIDVHRDGGRQFMPERTPKTDCRLIRIFAAWKKRDPPANRVKPVPVVVIRHIAANAARLPLGNKQAVRCSRHDHNCVLLSPSSRKIHWFQIRHHAFHPWRCPALRGDQTIEPYNHVRLRAAPDQTGVTRVHHTEERGGKWGD